jgi:hypothetical protein
MALQLSVGSRSNLVYIQVKPKASLFLPLENSSLTSQMTTKWYLQHTFSVYPDQNIYCDSGGYTPMIFCTDTIMVWKNI